MRLGPSQRSNNCQKLRLSLSAHCRLTQCWQSPTSRVGSSAETSQLSWVARLLSSLSSRRLFPWLSSTIALLPAAVQIDQLRMVTRCIGCLTGCSAETRKGLVWRALGIGASAWLTFYGVVVLVGIVERVIQQQIDENAASGPSLVRKFNERQAQRARELVAASEQPSVQRPKKRWRLLELLRALGRGSTTE
jgi:hypothetical protein